MMRKTLIRSFLIAATGATLCVPGAYADSQSGDFWSQLNSTDGGGNVFAHVPERAKVPATPEQAVNLRFLEAQRQISDGSANHFAEIPDRPKLPATPEQVANLRFLEAQRQISDGSGTWNGGAESGASYGVPARESSSSRMQAQGDGGDRVD
ncbi:MAG TPA: hypothetical protein VF859_00740 [Burkholderiales bacterium]